MTDDTDQVEPNVSVELERLYRNRDYVLPQDKDKKLETIFEQPRVNRDGSTSTMSKLKMKRFIDFEAPKSKKRQRELKVQKHIGLIRSRLQQEAEMNGIEPEKTTASGRPLRKAAQQASTNYTADLSLDKLLGLTAPNKVSRNGVRRSKTTLPIATLSEDDDLPEIVRPSDAIADSSESTVNNRRGSVKRRRSWHASRGTKKRCGGESRDLVESESVMAGDDVTSVRGEEEEGRSNSMVVSSSSSPSETARDVQLCMMDLLTVIETIETVVDRFEYW